MTEVKNVAVDKLKVKFTSTPPISPAPQQSPPSPRQRIYFDPCFSPAGGRNIHGIVFAGERNKRLQVPRYLNLLSTSIFAYSTSIHFVAAAAISVFCYSYNVIAFHSDFLGNGQPSTSVLRDDGQQG